MEGVDLAGAGGPLPAGLSGRVIRGGLWMVGLNVTGRLVGLLRLFLLARLLTPKDFGLVGVALVVISLFEAFSATGIHATLIERRERARELFDTAWTLGCLRGAAIATLMVVSAPLVGAFFGAPEAVAIVRVMALVPLLGGLGNVAVVEWRQELAFRSHYALHTVGVVADLCVAVPLALWLGSAWALVAGWVALGGVRAAMSYLLHPFRPRLRLDRAQARELVGFGRWVFLSAGIRWLLSNGVQAVVGRLLGLPVLAHYQMAWRIGSLPSTEVSSVITGVTPGAYARLREAPARLRRAHLRVLTIAAVAMVPVAVGTAVHGRGLVQVLLGERWAGTVPFLQILAVRGLARSVSDTTGALLLGIGRPRTETLVAAIELGLVAALFGPLLLGVGPAGPAIAVSAAALAGTAAGLWAVVRLLGIPGAELAGILGWPLLACVPVVVTQLGLVGPPGTPLGLAGAVTLSVLLYLGGLAALHRLGWYSPDPIALARLRGWPASPRPDDGGRGRIPAPRQ